MRYVLLVMVAIAALICRFLTILTHSAPIGESELEALNSIHNTEWIVADAYECEFPEFTIFVLGIGIHDFPDDDRCLGNTCRNDGDPVALT